MMLLNHSYNSKLIFINKFQLRIKCIKTIFGKQNNSKCMCYTFYLRRLVSCNTKEIRIMELMKIRAYISEMEKKIFIFRAIVFFSELFL